MKLASVLECGMLSMCGSCLLFYDYRRPFFEEYRLKCILLLILLTVVGYGLSLKYTTGWKIKAFLNSPILGRNIFWIFSTMAKTPRTLNEAIDKNRMNSKKVTFQQKKLILSFSLAISAAIGLVCCM
jgi:hypothetical protein